ncbi:MAG: tetratricopeptide repeat protein [Bacteroidota bacterium]
MGLHLKQHRTAFNRYLIGCLCLMNVTLNAQDEVIDSLKLKINTAKHDTTLCIALNALAEYIYHQAPDSAFVLLQKTIQIAAKNLKNPQDKNSQFIFSDVMAWAYLDIGVYHQSRKGPDEALKYLKKALAISTEIDSKACMANCLVDIGHVYYRKGHVLQALEYYHQGLKIYEKIDSPSSMAYCLGNIGNLYVAQGELENGFNYLNRSAKMYEKDNNNPGVAFALNGIADMYNEKGNPTCKRLKEECTKESKEKALTIYLKVLDLWNADQSKGGIAKTCRKIASVYRDQGNLEKAFNYANRSLVLYELIKNRDGTGETASMLANIVFDQGKVNLAETYADKAMKMGEILGNPHILQAASTILKKIYQKQNNYKGALEMQELSIKMRDSLNNETTRKISIKKQFAVEYEKQAEKDSILNVIKIEKEQFKHEQAIGKQRLYTTCGILGFVLMLMVTTILFRAFKAKQKANTIITQQSAKIEMANKDLERQHLLNQKIFSVISHDFRGPILSLNLVLNKFKNNSEDEKLNKYLKDIGTSVHNANTVLNNLLSWAKAEINLGSYDQLTSVVADVAAKVANEFRDKLEDKKLELIQHIPDTAQIPIPSDILTIALRNLISNAIKFSNTGNKIELSYDELSGTITVADHGLGMTPEKLDLLFKQQVSSDAGTQKEQGFGMGLYIVSELLYKYNYTITAESKLTEGTIFTIFGIK